MIEQIFREFCICVQKKKLAVEGIAIADERKILLEHHFAADKPRDIYSNTKSFLSTAVGMAVSEGALDLKTGFSEVFHGQIPEEAEQRLNAIQLRHLLTMSSGFGNAYLMLKDRRSGVGAPDYLDYMIGQELKEQPGSRFCYSTADSYLAGRMLEQVTGMRLSRYLYEKLFKPLNIGNPIWENDLCGHPIGGSGLQLRLGDMIKLGQLYLADGKWDGRQLLDPSWIRQATRKQIDTPQVLYNEKGEPKEKELWNCGYGYQFWISPYPGSYRADGSFGQVTTVLPEAGLVVATQCPEDGDFDEVRKVLHEIVLSQL